ncbi:hypothetical protein DSO57_1011290 [Entomophthora muscae]|uniref:Uncharacterized protein n=1 Tax=Entomophthora muscae TaxID=34485 RepID=A0ACC2TUW7_9FUNG|nr:hypothetical protein DSO57_1011290 [Entomophthora muscae]
MVRVMVLPEHFGLGLIGIPLASALTAWTSSALLLVAVATTSARQCWGGFSREALRGWGEYTRIAFPGMVMVAGIVWPIEFISFVASYFGPHALSSQSITNTIFQMMLLVHAGISSGSAIGVGNHLGGSLPNRSRLSAHAVLIFCAILGTMQSFGLLLWRDTVVGFFTKDAAVHKLAIETVTVVALSQPFKALGSISSGILRGQGRQRVSAFFKLSACYLLALPLGMVLAHWYEMGLLGLWIGVGVSWIYTALGELAAVLNTDWNRQVFLCQRRMNAYGRDVGGTFL